MKQILFAFLLLLSFSCHAQKKGDNTFLFPPSVPIDRFKIVLFQNGYSIENNDTVYLSTDTKAVPKTSVIMKFIVAKTDTAIFLKGMVKPAVTLGNFQADFSVAYFGGMKGSQVRDSWNEANRIALLIDSSVRYLKQ
ncbi:hypothetical protein BH10BAC2_BH10BAC2_10230 [soil metagenome]